MKKIILSIMAACLSFAFMPAEAATRTATINTEAAAATKATDLLERLQEIKTIDISSLSAPEKKELKQEVQSIKKQLKDLYGGVYLSAGTIILILILLIILT